MCHAMSKHMTKLLDMCRCFEFEVTFEDRLGIRIVGDGPSVVFSKLETNVVHTNGIVKTTSCVSSDRAESLFCKYRVFAYCVC